MVRLSVVIPCFNEYVNLVKTGPLIVDYFYSNFPDEDFELLFVNDGSTDKTLNLLKQLTIFSRVRVIDLGSNHGKGFAVNEGFRQSLGDLVLFFDADLATDLSAVHTACFTVNTTSPADVLIGDRHHVFSKVAPQSLFRRFIGRCFSLIPRVILRLPFADTQCGFKLFRGDVARMLAQKSRVDGWAFDVELLYLCKRYNFSVDTIPVKWHTVGGSRVHPLRDSYRMFRDVLRIRRLHG